MSQKKEVLQPGVERITKSDGSTYITREVKKKLNPFVKAKLLATLKRDDIDVQIDTRAASNDWKVIDSKGKKLFWYENAWDYGYYRIFAANPDMAKEPICVAEMDWFENDGHTSPDQQDIFDIFDALKAKKAQLEEIEKGRQNLTYEEVMALQALGFDEKLRI